MLKTIVLAAALASGAAILPACLASGSAYIVDEDPPAPREEVVVTRPGYFYVHGTWQRDGGNWRWRDGHYERERANQRYIEGRWERHGKRHVWVQGRWRTVERGVTVR